MRSRNSGSRSLQSRNHADGEFLWLMSLSDFLLLMFIFFVALFSFTASNISQSDYQAFRESVFGKPAIHESNLIEGKKYEQTRIALLEWLKARNLVEAVKIGATAEGISIQLKESVLFASGAYELSSEVSELLDMIAALYRNLPADTKMNIHGYTDRVPLKKNSNTYPRNNFELAAARAVSVMNGMQLTDFERSRVQVISHGPEQDSSIDPSQARRVLIEFL